MYGLQIIVIMALFVVSGGSTPSCSPDPMMGMMPCLMPVIGYAQTPEGAGLMVSLQSGSIPDNMGESQAKSLCKLAQGFVNCAADYMNACFGNDVANVQPLIRGTVKLAEVCDRADFYNKSKIFMTCGKFLNDNSPAYKACNELGKNSIPYLKTGDKNAAIQAVRSGAIVGDLCRSMKIVYDCQEPEVKKCTPEAYALNQDIFKAVQDAYTCNAKAGTGTGSGVSNFQRNLALAVVTIGFLVSVFRWL